MKRKAPILLPVFTTSVPLDFPPEGTFAFNKKTHKQLEVTVRINEHQYFNMNFLNHDGYIMACCRWAHVLDFAENGYDRYEHIIKKKSGRNILSSAVCMDNILIRLRTSTSPPSALKAIQRNGISPCASMEKSLMTCCMAIC